MTTKLTKGKEVVPGARFGQVQEIVDTAIISKEVLYELCRLCVSLYFACVIVMC